MKTEKTIMDEQRRALLPQNASTSNISDDEEEEEWSESSDDSYYSDSDSSIPEWESSVDDITGELLFVDCHPVVTQNNIDNGSKPKPPPEPFSKTQIRHSTRGKFLRLIRRRESKRHSRRFQKTQENIEPVTSNKVKFQDFQEGEEKEVLLKVNTENYLKSSQTGVLPEMLLGVNISTLSDGNRIMIAGFLPDSEAKHEKNIKIGDWLKSINNVDVNYQNINNVLHKIADKTEVLLKLQRVAGVEVTKDPPINELNCQSRFVRQLIDYKSIEQPLLEVLCKFPIGILYLNSDNLTESSAEHEDVVYCYPRPLQKSILCNSRGIFITLNHLLSDSIKSSPKSSTISCKDKSVAHVIYNSFEKKLLLFMLPDSCVSLKEAVLINGDLIRTLEFLYNSIDKCFMIGANKVQLDNFFGRLFMKILNGGSWTTSHDFVDRHKSSKTSRPQFEDVLPAANVLHLPHEANMQIDDALTELEASDYREWNEEPLDCQRLFTILGSALYHDGYLLASHLIYEDLVDVHVYCRLQGLFHLSKTEPIKTLVWWKEIFPHSCERFKNTNIKIPDGKRYLLIVGSGKDLLMTVMETGGCTDQSDYNTGPDAFYVEEAQATLAHIQELGLPELADRWIGMNPGPEVTIPEACNKRKIDFLDALGKSSLQHKEQRKPEVTSILKRRNSDQALATSVFSLSDDHYERYSEDSESQGEHSEVSDDKRNDDESDAEDYGDGSQMSNNSFDMSELRQTLLSETEDIQPQQLTSGNENVLFHYLKFDSTEGILICPPTCRLESSTLDLVLDNFRKCCHNIHSLFNNTMRFKNMPVQDMAKSIMNKSLIALKEHGVMFECPFLDHTDAKKNKLKYWVIGRLFYMPHPREMYVCYQDNIPQNIIEMAFKIDLSSMN